MTEGLQEQEPEPRIDFKSLHLDGNQLITTATFQNALVSRGRKDIFLSIDGEESHKRTFCNET